MAAVPGLDMAVHTKLNPDATDLAGYLYQAIGRMFSALAADSVSVRLAFFAVLWLALVCPRLLCQKGILTAA